MAVINARLQVFKIHDGAELITLTCDLNGVQLQQSRTISAFETFCEINKSPGNVGGTINLTGKYNGASGAIDATMSTLMGSDVPTLFEYFPEGSGSGKIRYYGSGYVTNYQVGGDAGGNVEVSATVEIDGDTLRDTI